MSIVCSAVVVGGLLHVSALAYADLRITTRETFDRTDTTVTTTVLSVKGARQRLEHRTWSTYMGGTSVNISITQCDEQRTLVLNQAANTYAFLPMEEARRARGAPAQTPRAEVDVLITIDAVDTGEVRQIGRVRARHVITTTTMEPAPGARADVSSLMVEDGWYLERSYPGCAEDGAGGEAAVAVLWSFPGRAQITHRGRARRGYPLDVKTRVQAPLRSYTSTRTLVAVSEGPLGADLFTVPAAYRPALPRPGGGHDYEKPDTVLNRLVTYWDVLMSWTSYWVR